MKQTIYTPNLSADTVARDFKGYRFNLRTMRGRLKMERRHSCAYISNFAQYLARQDGITLAREEVDGSAYSYMAYCANEAHRLYVKRRRHRRRLFEGWSFPTGQEPVGAAFVAIIRDEITAGRIIDSPHGRAFMPNRNRRNGYLLNQPIYIKPQMNKATKAQPAPALIVDCATQPQLNLAA